MNSVWHNNALKAVQDNLLGSRIVEVLHKMPWGFDEIDRQAVKAMDFLLKGQEPCDTCILHILLGEGFTVDVVLAVLKKALAISTRVLILEHNPGNQIFKGNYCVSWKRVNALAEKIEKAGYDYTKIDIDGRNFLFCVTALQGTDNSFGPVSNRNLARLLSYQYENGLPEKDRNIFCMSSERQKDGNTVLSEADARYIDSLDSTTEIYSVIGGMMFLNLLAELGTLKVMVLFDISLPQVLFAMVIAELIKVNETLKDFDKAVNTKTPTLRKLRTLCNTEQLIGWMKDSIERLPRPDKDMVWVNIIKAGHWREQYVKVREFIVNGGLRFHFGGLPELKIPDGSVLYVSTVKPDTYSSYTNCHIIEAYSCRDVPVLEKR